MNNSYVLLTNTHNRSVYRFCEYSNTEDGIVYRTLFIITDDLLLVNSNANSEAVMRGYLAYRNCKGKYDGYFTAKYHTEQVVVTIKSNAEAYYNGEDIAGWEVTLDEETLQPLKF